MNTQAGKIFSPLNFVNFQKCHSQTKPTYLMAKEEETMRINQISAAQGNLLIVDDTPENLELLGEFLIPMGYTIHHAFNGETALKIAKTVKPDLILLDIMLPFLNGYQVCQLLKANPVTAEIPVIFLSALNESFYKEKAYEVGAVDYITNPFVANEIIRKVRTQLEFKATKQENTWLQNELISQKQNYENSLKIASDKVNFLHCDRLTGLPNREFFTDFLQTALNCLKTNQDYQFSLLFFDCDRFNILNNSLGAKIGDELLKSLVKRLQNCLNKTDVLARIDEKRFGILLIDTKEAIQASKMAKQIQAALTQPFYLQGYEIFMTASIGIVVGNTSYSQPEHLMRDAETALDRARQTGKDQYQIFDQTMKEKACKFLQVEIELRRAIKQQEFKLHYQPIIDLKTGCISGLEALVRWQHPVRGLLPPAEFISIAEETGLISDIGKWVLREACHQLSVWQKAGLADSSLTISVNLSARQFNQVNLIDQIDQVFVETQLNPECLKLEITESAIMENTQAAAKVLQQLRERKIQLSLDDFGIGYSSLSYLHSFPVDTIKVDKSFVGCLDDNDKNLGLVPAIMCIAKTMGMSVIAEGIETHQQLNHLRNLQCDYSQGYLFSRPLEAEKIIDLIASSPKW